MRILFFVRFFFELVYFCLIYCVFTRWKIQNASFQPSRPTQRMKCRKFMCKPSVTRFHKLNETIKTRMCNIYAFQKGRPANRRFDDDASVIKQMMHGLDCKRSLYILYWMSSKQSAAGSYLSKLYIYRKAIAIKWQTYQQLGAEAWIVNIFPRQNKMTWKASCRRFSMAINYEFRLDVFTLDLSCQCNEIFGRERAWPSVAQHPSNDSSRSACSEKRALKPLLISIFETRMGSIYMAVH